MKTARYFLIMLLLTIMGTVAQAQTRNEIIIPDQPFWANYIELPISIENTDPIVAMQCDLLVPDFLTTFGYEGEMVIKDRCVDHQLTVRGINTEGGKKKIRVLLYSPSNTPLAGNSGTVAKIRLGRPEDVSIVYGQIAIENAVLTTVEGNNVLTGTTIGMLDFTDLPTLQVKASSTTITEGDVLKLTVSTDHANEQPLPITLQSEDDARFDYPMQSIIPAGQTSVTIDVKTIDDDIPQLDQSNLFTVSAPEHHNAEVLVLLKDNDIPELSLTLNVNEVNELDGDGAVTATLRRVTNKNNKITVQISDDAHGRLTYAQQTIEMAKGVDEVTFHLGPVDNDAEDGDRTYHVTAAIFVASCDCAVGGESAGFVQADLKVLDDDGPNGHQPTRKLADAIVSSLTIDKTEVTVGDAATFSVTVKNQGTDVLPAVNVSIYSDKNGHVATLRTTGALGVDQSDTQTRKVYLTSVGRDAFHAVVNETEEAPELRYQNNESAKVAMKVRSPWTATLTTDRKVYTKGDSVVVSGQLEGNSINHASVEIYVINDGCRQIETIVSDAQGKFALTWHPYEYQSGHFMIGACYPGEEINTAMAEVDIYGLRRVERSTISCEVTIDEPYRGNIMLENPGVLGLTGVKTEVTQLPDGCTIDLSVPATIAADAIVPLQFTINGSKPSPKRQWEQIRFNVVTAEGVCLPITIYYNAQYAQACLVPAETRIYTTMVMGAPREYPFVVTNTGRGPSGKITLSLPRCMSSGIGTTLSSLAPGDSVMLPLRFVPLEGMQLNVPVTGMFSITCENGIGATVDFTVRPVSEATGTLVVDVTDEFTYYTEEAPHVAGAEVVLRNPVTEETVAQGLTDENGLCSFTLPEGYYELFVTAQKHNSYKNNIIIDPGVITEKEVCLSYDAVTVTWTVEETEVEDEYKIVTTVDFETRVPVPVVQLNVVPERIGFDHLQPGESLIYHTVMTNKGLIMAWDCTLGLPEDGYFKFEPLAEYEHIDLPAQHSYVVPVKVTRIDGTTPADSRLQAPRRAGGGLPCYMGTEVWFKFPCGNEYHFGSSGAGLYSSGADCGGSGGSGGGGGGAGGFGGEPGSGSGFSFNNVWGAIDCNQCSNSVIGVVSDCGISMLTNIPYIGCAIGILNCAKGLTYDGPTASVLWGCSLTVAGCLLEVACPECVIASRILGIISCLTSIFSAADSCGKSGGGSGSGAGGLGGLGGDGDKAPSASKAPRRADVLPSYMEDYKEKCKMVIDFLEADMNKWHEAFGDTIWFNNFTTEQFTGLMTTIEQNYQNGAITADMLAPYKPRAVSQAQLQRLVERLNNTRHYELTGERSENMIDLDYVMQQYDIMQDVEYRSIGYGYESTNDMITKETRLFMDRASEESPGVCATVKLQIDQTMTMTRQAFRGKLTIENGSDHAAMQDIKLRLKVTNNQGLMATAHEFEMHVESLDGFTGAADFDSGWALVAGEKGTANIIFIPTKYAAPIIPVDYSFGGTLSYVDANTGIRVTRELFPVTLTVNPSPELDLTYFMQRDIFGDDPLTEDVVEPMIPAEFTVVINNKGYGDATNVRMLTEQPKIIENEKGLYIDFEILSSTLKGEDRVLAMGQTVPTEFGTIPAHSQTWGSWELQSTLLGHFVQYKIEATHVTSYGNPDLSLLDQVTIHELIHGFTYDEEQKIRGFLVNDVLDADDTPETVYFSDATQAEVKPAAYVEAERQSDTTCLLKVTPSVEGWTYGSVEDPMGGRAKLLRVVRKSDGVELPLDNVWQTDRTLRDAKAPLYENRLHVVASVPQKGETYELQFEQRPSVELAVDKFIDVPVEDTVITYQLPKLTVRFTKPIDATTFTFDDIRLCCQGAPLDISRMPIERVNDTDYKMLLNGLTEKTGYYVMTVQTANITDAEGYLGSTGKQATWIQLLTQGIAVPWLDDSDPSTNPSPSGQYDLGGRRIGNTHRGLHIENGRIVMSPKR